MYLASDNGTGASEQVISHLVDAMRGGPVPSYGADALTAQLQDRMDALFGCQTQMFLLTSGTAANALAIAHVTPPWGAILAHEEAHIITSECGAPEFFSGARCVTIAGQNGKLKGDAVDAAAASLKSEDPHGVKPACLSLTNLTECGTLYLPDEIKALTAAAKKHGMTTHLDGARFANAVAASGLSPAALTWQAGIDVMSFGATKNGAIAAEAILFFDPALAKDFKYRRMRAGHLISKHRFIAAQYLGWLENGHWLDLARHANAQAAKLANAFKANGFQMAFPVEGNEVFVYLPQPVIAALKAKGANFYDWMTKSAAASAPQGTQLSRFVCAFNTTNADVGAFSALLAQSAK